MSQSSQMSAPQTPLSRSNITSTLNQKEEIIADIASKCQTHINKIKYDADNEFSKISQNHLKEVRRLHLKIKWQTAKDVSEFDALKMHITRTQESAERYKEQAGHLKEQINVCYARIPDLKAMTKAVSATIAEYMPQLRYDIQVDENI